MPTAPAKARGIVLCVAFAGFIATLDDYIVVISLPAIASDFGASTSEVALVTVVYLLALVSSLLPFGRLGDRVGFRRVFVAGYAVFVTASALCSIAPGIGFLIGARFVQGLGAAMLSVTGPAIIARHVPADRRGWAFGILTTVTALGITLGAPLGGLISGLWDWRMVFLVNVPIGLAAMVAAHRTLPPDDIAPRTVRGGYDIPGVLLSFVGLLLLILALNQGEELGGWTSPPVVACFVGAAVLLTALVVRELRTARPLLDLRALRDRRLATGLLAALSGYVLLAGCNFAFPFYLIYVKQMRPEQVGLVMIVYSVVYVGLSPRLGRLSDRRSARVISAVGMAVAGLACVGLVLGLGVAGLVVPITYLVFRAGAYAAFISPNNALVMARSEAGAHGSVSALLKVAVNLSLILGLVLFETLFSLPLPEHAGSVDQMLASGAASTDLILSGLALAYAAGSAICLGAAAATMAGRHRARPTPAAPVPRVAEGDAGQRSRTQA